MFDDLLFALVELVGWVSDMFPHLTAPVVYAVRKLVTHLASAAME